MAMSKDFVRELKDGDSVIKDVTLIGSDGGRVSASKTILAIRSPVFRNMFFGNFRESEQDCKSVALNYTALVLQELVNFCYTNEISIYVKDAHSAEVLGTLLDAGNYFGMTEMFDASIKIDEEFSASTILEGLLDREIKGCKLWDSCMKSMIENEYFGHNVSLALLEATFEDAKRKLGVHRQMAELRSWYEERTSNRPEGPITENEKYRLQKLVDSIILENKWNEDTLLVIKPCPLFSQERLNEAVRRCDQEMDQLIENIFLNRYLSSPR